MMRPESVSFDFNWLHVQDTLIQSMIPALSFVWNVNNEVTQLVLSHLEDHGNERPKINPRAIYGWVGLFLRIDLVRLGMNDMAIFTRQYNVDRF